MKDKEKHFKIDYTLEDIYKAVEYGFKYATESQNDGFVPKGNTLQWLKHYKNISLDAPVEQMKDIKTAEEFIEKWNVGYEDREQKLEFSNEMKNDLDTLFKAKVKAISDEEIFNTSMGNQAFQDGANYVKNKLLKE